MSDNLVIESPDFDQIIKESGDFTSDAIKLLWYSLNNEILLRRKLGRINWEDVSHGSLTFGASAGTWTVASGDLTSFKFGRWNDFIIVEFVIVDSSTSAGMGTTLTITVPHGLSAQAGYTGWGWATGNINELFPIVPTTTTLSFFRADGSSWPSSVTDDLDLRGAVIFRV